MLNVGWNILMSRYQWRRDKSDWQTDTAQKPGNHLECHLTHFKRNSSRSKPLKCPQEWNQCSQTFICQVRSVQPVVQLICGSLGGCKWPSLELISLVSGMFRRSALVGLCRVTGLWHPGIDISLYNITSRPGTNTSIWFQFKTGSGGKTWILCRIQWAGTVFLSCILDSCTDYLSSQIDVKIFVIFNIS